MILTKEERKELESVSNSIERILNSSTDSTEITLQPVNEPAKRPSLVLTKCANLFKSKGLKITSTDISAEMLKDGYLDRRNGVNIPTVKAIEEGICEDHNPESKTGKRAKSFNNVQIRITPKGQDLYEQRFSAKQQPVLNLISIES